VTSEYEFVVVGVNADDRPGLLLDISKGLLRLNLSLRHTEASVVGQRSISIWRCELLENDLPDLEEIWSVLNVSVAAVVSFQKKKQTLGAVLVSPLFIIFVYYDIIVLLGPLGE
jgi:hypothetical protein